MNSGLFEAHKKEDCEVHLAQSIKAEVQKLWDRTVAHIQQAMEARRHGPLDPGAPYQPDYEKKLREYEGQMDGIQEQIRQIARDHEPAIRIEHSGRGGPPQWQNKFILLVGVSLVASGIVGTVTVCMTVSSLRSRIETYIQANDQRLQRDENLIDATQRRLDRGAGM